MRACDETCPDTELVRRSREGDGAAFGALMLRHHDLVQGVCRRVTRNDADTDDAVQETRRAAWRGLSGFDGRSAVSTWLYRIARNEATDVIGRARRAPVPLAEIPDRRAPGEVESQVVDRMAVADALAGVPQVFRAAVELRDVHGWTYDEIAEGLGISIDTVKSRISRGRVRLRDRLAERTRPAGQAP